MGKPFFDLHKLVKMLGFINEFHDIYDPIIYGRSMKAIKHAIQKKWNDPQMESKYFLISVIDGFCK